MKQQRLSTEDTFAYLTNDLDPEHDFWQLNEDDRVTAIGLSCNRDGTAAFYNACARKSEAHDAPIIDHAKDLEERIIEWLSSRDKTVYLYLSQFLTQSQRPKDEVKRIFGTLHKEAALLGAFRCAVYLSLPNHRSSSTILKDNEYAALSYLMGGDLLSDSPQEQLEDIFERSANPMQDVTYFVTVAGLKLLDRYKEVFGDEMSRDDFQDVQEKLCSFYSIPASSGRKKLVLEMSNFLYFPDAVQFKRCAKGKLSFTVTPHTEAEISPYIHKDDIYFQQHAPQGKGSGCPALHARIEQDGKTLSVLSATATDFLDLFRHVVFDPPPKSNNIPDALCVY